MDNDLMIKDLERKIEFWNFRIERSKNTQEKAFFDSKIKEAREQLEQIRGTLPKSEVVQRYDDPVLADAYHHGRKEMAMKVGGAYKFTI